MAKRPEAHQARPPPNRQLSYVPGLPAAGLGRGTTGPKRSPGGLSRRPFYLRCGWKDPGSPEETAAAQREGSRWVPGPPSGEGCPGEVRVGKAPSRHVQVGHDPLRAGLLCPAARPARCSPHLRSPLTSPCTLDSRPECSTSTSGQTRLPSEPQPVLARSSLPAEGTLPFTRSEASDESSPFTPGPRPPALPLLPSLPNPTCLSPWSGPLSPCLAPGGPCLPP